MNLESRIAALELLAAKEPTNMMPPKTPLSFEEVRKRLDAILTAARPERTRDEVIADFKASIVRMQANWRLRHEQS